MVAAASPLPPAFEIVLPGPDDLRLPQTIRPLDRRLPSWPEVVPPKPARLWSVSGPCRKQPSAQSV